MYFTGALIAVQNNNIINNSGDHESSLSTTYAPSEIIKDYKKLNDANMTLVQNTVKQNAKNYEKIDQLKQQQRPTRAPNNCIYSSVNHVGTKSPSCDDNLQPQQLKPKVSKTSNECVLMSMMQSEKARVVDYEHVTSGHGNATGRSASERKVCSKNASEKSESYHRFNSANSPDAAEMIVNKPKNRVGLNDRRSNIFNERFYFFLINLD